MKIYGTAKGGALSKKDFGVAFGGGGGVPSYDLEWEQTDGGELQGLKVGGNTAAGLTFYTGQTMIGKVPNKVTCYLKTLFSPVGIATLKLISSTNVVKITYTPTQDAAALTTSFAEYSFTNDSTSTTIADGDRLVWFYSGSASFVFEMAATATEVYTQQSYSTDNVNWSSYDVGDYPSKIKIYSLN